MPIAVGWILLTAAAGCFGQNTGDSAEAALRETFELHVGDVINVPEAGLQVELMALSYRRCPLNALCRMSDGPVVDFRVVEIESGAEIQRGEMLLAPPSRYPYFVLPMDSDGDTYARFSVHSAEAWCAERASAREERDCWSRLADMTRQPEFCARAASTGQSGESCYEHLAEQTMDASLCENVSGTRGWCRFEQVTSNIENDAADCSVLLKWSHRTSCYRLAAEKLGGPAACARMRTTSAQTECERIVTDEDKR